MSHHPALATSPDSLPPAPLEELGPRAARHAEIIARIHALTAGENDSIALMATIACELHHGLDHFHWTGFYRVVSPGLLKIGPYQGTHGCLSIPFERGICGRCAREQRTLVIHDVDAEPDHIACSSSTRSEIVVPVFDSLNNLRAVLDVDSDLPSAFDESDARLLQHICSSFSSPVIDWQLWPDPAPPARAQAPSHLPI